MKKYYYTIGEVSNLIDVKPHVIRYWESEFSALRPKKGDGHIRKYNEEHILLLKKIKYMLYTQRFTIEGARQKLKNERHPIASITATELPQAAASEPVPASASPSPSPKMLSTVIASVRDDLNTMITLCKSYSKEHK